MFKKNESVKDYKVQLTVCDFNRGEKNFVAFHL
jgi:hypothetical protein